MNVLVTGATGFIGQHLVRALAGKGHTIRALVRDRRRAPVPGDVELFEGDLLRPESLEGIERGVDCAIHCASVLGKWGTSTATLQDVNVGGTVHLLNRFRDGRLRRFLYLSAGGVTGPVPSRAVDETYDCRPATAYELTKLEAERTVLEASRAGLPATVLRPTFTYGPGDPHKIGLFRAIKRGRYAFIDGGESVNHPVYVEDLVAGILLGLERGATGEVYIIGGERPVTKKEMAFAIADALGVRRPSLAIPRGVAWPAAVALELVGRTLRFEPILTRSRVMMMADNFGYRIDKARQRLGYVPRVDLGDGITRTVAYYRERGLL